LAWAVDPLGIALAFDFVTHSLTRISALETFFAIVILWPVFSFVAGIVAHSKGRSGTAYFFLSLIVSPLVGLLLVGMMPTKSRQSPAEPTIRCPECAEFVLVVAKKCKHCGAALPEIPQFGKPVRSGQNIAENRAIGIGAVLLVVIPLAILMTTRRDEAHRLTLSRSPQDTALVAKIMCKAEIAKNFKIVEWVDEVHWRVDWPTEGSWIVSARTVSSGPGKSKTRRNFECIVAASGKNETLFVKELNQR
jgi:hypothetical protein